MLHNLRSTSFAGIFIFVVLSTNAHAVTRESPIPEKPQTEDKNWNFEIGAGVMYGPEYDGSDNYGVKPIPTLSVEYKNGLFFAGLFDGIGSYFLQDENYKVGASIGYSMGRDEDDDKDNLRGMGDIDMGATASLMGEYNFGPLQFSGKVSTGSGDYGTTATVEVGTMFPVTERLMVMASIGPTWADEEHMQSYFGVSSTQSARSGYNRYDADSGFKSVSVSAGTFYDITEHWGVMLMVNCDQLLGDAADSPITKEDFSTSVMFTTSYKF